MCRGRKQKRGRKMDRRGRRGRGHSRTIPSVAFAPNSPENCRKSFTGCLSSFLILSSLIALIFMMLDYQCTTCAARCDLNNITKNIDDIAINLSLIKASYYDLENKISKYSQDLPKIEGQIEILEALANTMETKDFDWNPKPQFSLPNLDIYSTDSKNRPLRNSSNIGSKCSTEICSTNFIED